MKLIDKYLLREYIITVTYCLLGFSIIYVIGDLFSHLSDFLEANTPARLVALYYGCFLATIIEFIVPASLLFATLYTLWQFTRHNEITALRASGTGMHRIIMPFLAVGLFFTLFTGIIKEFVAPRANVLITELDADPDEDESVLSKTITLNYMNSNDHRQWIIEEFRASRPEEFRGINIRQERPDHTTARKISAEKAEWINGVWHFHNAVVREYGKSDNPVGEPKKLGDLIKMPSLTERPSDFANEIRPWYFLSASEMKRYLDAHPNLPPSAVARKKFDMHNRLAMPWACLIVTLFAIPAGAGTGRKSAIAGIFLAMAFFFSFYALNRIGMFLSMRQVVQPWMGAWLANMTFLAAGVIMLARMETRG